MRKILVVDDDPNIRFLYKEVLSEGGYKVLEAGSGIETFKILNHEDIDLVLLDIKLRFESGLGVLQRITKKFPNTPVILCTAYISFQDDFTSWLADSYYVKSSNPYELLDEVKQVLSKKALANKHPKEDLRSNA
ncbi:response regulator [Desulfobacterota bacterium AH_259_B03_O07]|nr:response regulator [Desulfobacterota bacterium AH_259_B03_O07]